MQVIFYNVPDSRIKNFEKYAFGDAVAISHEVEHNCREEKIQFSSEFQVLDDNDKIYYKGTFDFGSYDYPNLYHKIKYMVNRIRVAKENQADKLYLLEKIEELTPGELKKDEIVDKLMVNLDRTNVSKLKSWQRKTIYTLGSLGFTAFLALGFVYIAEKGAYEKALDDGRNQIREAKKLSELYEIAILGDKTEMIASLEKLKKDKMTEKQLQILFVQYVENEEFTEAVALFDNDSVQAETMIMNSSIAREVKKDKLTKFNKAYPTNEAKYDLAYIDGDYELMLNVPNVMMTVTRSEMKTYALMKIGKIDEAKIELNNNNNEELANKITEYEVLTAEIKTLQEKNKLLLQDKKVPEAQEIQAQITEKQKELKAL